MYMYDVGLTMKFVPFIKVLIQYHSETYKARMFSVLGFSSKFEKIWSSFVVKPLI